MVRYSGRPVTEVSTALGVSPRTLSDWMSGRRLPTLPQQNACAQYFAVDRGYLFGTDQ